MFSKYLRDLQFFFHCLDGFVPILDYNGYDEFENYNEITENEDDPEISHHHENRDEELTRVDTSEQNVNKFHQKSPQMTNISLNTTHDADNEDNTVLIDAKESNETKTFIKTKPPVSNDGRIARNYPPISPINYEDIDKFYEICKYYS